MNAHRFARLLTQAVTVIKARENKNLGIIEDELGFELGRKSGSAIRYWRKGHLPAEQKDVLLLTKALIVRGGFTRTQAEQFLESADCPHPETLVTQLFGEAVKLPQKNGASLDLQSFVVGPPVSNPYQFFGRERQLQRIFSSWHAIPLQNIALVGPRRSGKTSLVHYVHKITTTPSTQLRASQRSNWLVEPAHYRWALIDFQDPRLVKLQYLLPFILRELGCPVPSSCSLEVFMEVMIENMVSPTIILMDELAAALASPDLGMDFWYCMRSLVNTYSNGQIAFLLTSHTPPFEIAADIGKPSPFFNMFNLVDLGPFELHESQELIAQSPISFSDEDTNWIIQQSGNWPILVQLFCQECLASLMPGGDRKHWKQHALRRASALSHLRPSQSCN